MRVPVTGIDGIPADATSITANLTVTDPHTGGYLTTDTTSPPTTSTLNFQAGQTVAHLTTIPINSDGTITIRNISSGTAQIITDLAGYNI